MLKILKISVISLKLNLLFLSIEALRLQGGAEAARLLSKGRSPAASQMLRALNRGISWRAARVSKLAELYDRLAEELVPGRARSPVPAGDR